MGKESEKEIRMQELHDHWSAETNDPETQEWRDNLSVEELAQVEKWDDDMAQKLAKMAFDILSLEAKKKEAMKNISFYRIVRDPEESWKPYRSEPMYDDHSEMGSYQSSYGLSSPKAGDYLVTDQTKISVRTASDRDFEDVRFLAIPPLDEMLSSGMVVRVPQQLMEQDLEKQGQIQYVTDKMAECQQHMDEVKDYIADLHSEPTSSEAKSENVRNAMEELQKTQTEIAELEGQLLNLEEKYQRFYDKGFRPPDRTFITEESWRSQVVPANVKALVEAFNTSMNDYIRTTDLSPEIAEDEIRKQVDRLWEQYCKTGEIAGVREQQETEFYEQTEERNAPNPLPVGRIDYLRSNGLVGESVEYTDLQKFEADLKKETYYGAPLSVVLYRDRNGKLPEHKFIF